MSSLFWDNEELMSSDSTRELLLIQVDESLAKWREASLSARPKSGWIRTIRGALRMSGAALARRLGVTERAVLKLEAAEAEDRMTLGTLRRVAQSLDCELQYALVPRRPLVEVLNEQARRVAERELFPVAHSMALEDQAVDDERRKHLDFVARTMLAKSRRDLW